MEYWQFDLQHMDDNLLRANAPNNTWSWRPKATIFPSKLYVEKQYRRVCSACILEGGRHEKLRIAATES